MTAYLDLPDTQESMKMGIRRRLHVDIRYSSPVDEAFLSVEQVTSAGQVEWTAMLPIAALRAFAGLAALAASVAAASARQVVEDQVKEALRQALARVVTGGPYGAI